MSLPRLTPAAEKVMAAAAAASAELGNAHIGVEHLFMGLVAEVGEPLAQAFEKQKADIGKFVELLREKTRATEDVEPRDVLVFTTRSRDVLQLAGRIALSQGEQAVGPDHILDSILREGRSVPVRLLRAAGIQVAELHEAFELPRESEETATPTLAKHGRDLTQLARAGRLSPLIGRAKELDLLFQVLLRRNKNNPVLVGEAGVGKTAIVEGLAQRLISKECPEPLKGCRVIELSIASLVAGTKYRGDFEERLMSIIREASSHPEIILFLDEVHTLVGAGSAGDDSLDASNIFKPALARGEVRCVGATTVEEFRRCIEKDSALERRFDKILVDEPTPAEATEILTGLKPALESHHRVEIAPEAIQAAVDLTVRHVADRQLPDKALDAIDQTCARKRLERYAGPSAAETRPSAIRVTEEDVTRTVATWTGIPLERLSRESSAKVLNLEADLKSRVVGQDHAAAAVARAIMTSRAGLASPRRPAGVFFFLGPTGVGKTELAKSLAAVLFGDEKRLVRFDMSEYMEPHSISKMIGAPPGYVGFEREGLLISALRTHPHCVVLFDEVEKAHPQVFDLFLQIFDEGRLTGTHGRTADFSQSVVIMTSNLVPVAIPPGRELGFHAEEPEAPMTIDVRAALTSILRPELVNRIDEIILFNSLGRSDLRRIVDRYVKEIESLLAPRKAGLALDDAVYDFLLQHGVSDRFGARELRRVVDRHLRQPLAREVLSRAEGAATIRVEVKEGALHFG